MFRCIFGVRTHGQLGKRPHPVLGSTYRIGIGLDKSLISFHAISYLYTDSSGGILIYSRYPTKPRWWLIHVGMSLWYVVHLNTYLNLVSYLIDTKIRFNCKSNLTSAIGNFSKSRHLASYISRHNAMAYDTCPPKWSWQTWNLCGKEPWYGKKLTVTIQEFVKDVRIVLLSNKRKILWK